MASVETRLRKLEGVPRGPAQLDLQEEIALQERIVRAQGEVLQVFRRLARESTTFGPRGARPKTAEDREREAEYLEEMEVAVAQGRQHLAALKVRAGVGTGPADGRSAKHGACWGAPASRKGCPPKHQPNSQS